MGFGFLFKLEDSSIERHKDERKIRGRFFLVRVLFKGKFLIFCEQTLNTISGRYEPEMVLLNTYSMNELQTV